MKNLMKHLKLFEDFKVNNITEEDVVNTITNDGVMYVTSIKDLPDHIVETPVTPVDIKGDTITLNVDGKIYTTSLEFVDKIEY
ncbi:MAG: hypothetical protein SLAVMIC_00416 [uncultured marine phage]|uniref:Uncharacterized protein n=1 Tax=uncultured marine phage TaxID=707152 RepID=A0A8D9CE53_9VIRU|nr:MAG: hypothetical protein SLAVMIC_00416 [uncultured marine phage]